MSSPEHPHHCSLIPSSWGPEEWGALMKSTLLLSVTQEKNPAALASVGLPFCVIMSPRLPLGTFLSALPPQWARDNQWQVFGKRGTREVKGGWEFAVQCMEGCQQKMTSGDQKSVLIPDECLRSHSCHSGTLKILLIIPECWGLGKLCSWKVYLWCVPFVDILFVCLLLACAYCCEGLVCFHIGFSPSWFGARLTARRNRSSLFSGYQSRELSSRCWLRSSTSL